jgi:aspartate/methionine/tyrosine aminotransferase
MQHKGELEATDAPATVVPHETLIPVSDHLGRMTDIPPSRMFLIKKSLAVYRQNHPGGEVFDASQGDGGASLPGVPAQILERALALQLEHGTQYDMPYGCDDFRKSVVEDYWHFEEASGLGPKNVLATVGGRDALVKAYTAMLGLGTGREGDLVVVSRVPWISYNWGPYGVGANVLLAPGVAEDGWVYTEDSLRACAKFAKSLGRKIAGLVITCPDNPTGATMSANRQAELAEAALSLDISFVLFDWMYHFVTDEAPMDLNGFVQQFDPADRSRLMFLDGLTKSLGGSNVRNAHLIASEPAVKYISARASHGVIPSYYGMAVAMAAYSMGYKNASRGIVQPTNASRKALRAALDDQGLKYVLGQGYYSFIHVGPWLEKAGWKDSEPLGAYLAEEHGLAVVPGAFFSRFGGEWIRFSYATPVERTLGAAHRLQEGLNALMA